VNEEYERIPLSMHVRVEDDESARMGGERVCRKSGRERGESGRRERVLKSLRVTKRQFSSVGVRRTREASRGDGLPVQSAGGKESSQIRHSGRGICPGT
jgi:hypothetical protein